ncbi:TPA: hypothetical protein I2Z88_RS13585 [Staphylococcus aureus]|uniref:hypothetical protein n=1 Tax=Staphylococcus aureus TaxID=1280 RepID=UPI0006C44975|nr:hypothetical protein [Staphylococcus aureus]KOS65050.1 hypothetical protein AN169_13830 [Staphylococcus aureus]MST21217.1 hypothetical protein [Staphylococcus aureus]HBI0898527.1 hypothetical protein [Staphylococcus aureus]
MKVGPWNGSSKNATNSIKPFQKAGVKKTVKILKKKIGYNLSFFITQIMINTQIKDKYYIFQVK